MKNDPNAPAAGPSPAEMEAKTLADVRHWVRLNQERITRETAGFRKLLYCSIFGLAVLILGSGWWSYSYSRRQASVLLDEVSSVTGLKEDELKRARILLERIESELERVRSISFALDQTNASRQVEFRRLWNESRRNLDLLSDHVREAEASAANISATAMEMRKLDETRKQILEHLNKAIQALSDKSPERLRQEVQQLEKLQPAPKKSP